MKQITYEQAMTQLEALAAQMEKGELGIDELSQRLKEAQRLIKFCRQKLLNVEKEIHDILEQDATSSE
ncbi:MAG: exodeoxyribonuclease VII small subunit [Prevotellaceae bacterium]|nr:exodeoxyribonuclease VII small subunit [Prevotellaceae bacterium]MDY6098807.1 exodeoxyribonuclease VII small subunit [Bacteroidaceae bacterium]